jgi:predicted small secreted protein
MDCRASLCFVGFPSRAARRLHIRSRLIGAQDATNGAAHLVPATDQGVPMKRLTALLLLALFSIGTLTACNTVAGAGKDVKKAGEKVEQKAEDVRDGK